MYRYERREQKLNGKKNKMKKSGMGNRLLHEVIVEKAKEKENGRNKKRNKDK